MLWLSGVHSSGENAARLNLEISSGKLNKKKPFSSVFMQKRLSSL
jgi:hypothetical protein